MKIDGVLPIIVFREAKRVAHSTVGSGRIGRVVVTAEPGAERQPGQVRDDQVLEAFLSRVRSYQASPPRESANAKARKASRVSLNSSVNSASCAKWYDT